MLVAVVLSDDTGSTANSVSETCVLAKNEASNSRAS